MAILTDATPEAFARALEVVSDPAVRTVGDVPEYDDTRYTYEASCSYPRGCGHIFASPRGLSLQRVREHYSYRRMHPGGRRARRQAIRRPIGHAAPGAGVGFSSFSGRSSQRFLIAARPRSCGNRAGARAIRPGVDESAKLRVARRRATESGLSIGFLEGDAHALAFADRSFDAVVCLRLLMHVPNWRLCLEEICRVADRRLVFDYPALASAASAEAAWRRVALRAGRKVEAYRVFSRRAVARELNRHDFRIVGIHKQFVLPIAVHKSIGSSTFTKTIEGALSSIGILKVAGSPVTVSAERCGS